MTLQVPKGRMIYFLILDIFLLIFPLNNNQYLSPPPPVSLLFLLCSFQPDWKIIHIITKKNVLLDVFLCMKDFKIGKGCWRVLVISYLYSHTHVWKKKPTPLNKINTSFNFYVFSPLLILSEVCFY